MHFKGIFILYCCLLGFFVGSFSALFLALVEFMLHFIWETIPNTFDPPLFYPLLIGICGGVLVGLTQKYWGPYPKTMHETLHEFQQTRRVAYTKVLAKNFISAIIVLGFGASLGPEAALASILGGLITWAGDHMKLTFSRKEELTELGFKAVFAAVFSAPLVGLSDAFEDEKGLKLSKSRSKTLLYTLSTVAGFLGFSFINSFLPKENIFFIRIPAVTWDYRLIFSALPAILLGISFGYLFLALEKFSDNLVKGHTHPIFFALCGGLLLGGLGMCSHYFLYSGEHAVFPLSRHYTEYSVLFLVFLALGKACLTHLSFAFGWRGGKIFPAIFASTALACAFAKIFPYTPGATVALIVATSITIILKRPLFTALLLLLLFPLQYFPLLLLACFLAKQSDTWRKNYFKKISK